MPVETVTLTDSAVTGVHADGEPYRMAVAALPLTVKLGRKAPTKRAFVPRFASYLKLVEGTPPPVKVDWYTKAATSVARMYLNDQLGDCVIAGKYHGIGAASANDGGTARVGPDSEVNANYQRICGPGDNGCVITDVLDDMAAGRFLVGGSPAKLDGYVSIDWTNQAEVQVALYLFGWLTVGINLPAAWESNSVWDVTNTQIVGGHDVTALGYDEKGVYIASWGRIYLITWKAFLSRSWIEELYAPLGPDWYGSDKLAPSGVDFATLQADLALLKQGQTPPIPSPPSPPPPSPPSPPPPPVPDPNADVLALLHKIALDPTSPHFEFAVGELLHRSNQAAYVGLAGCAGPFEVAAPINWLVILTDALVVVADYKSGNKQQLVSDVLKLLADLGLNLTPQHHAVMHGHLTKLSPDQWAAIIQAILQLLAAFGK